MLSDSLNQMAGQFVKGEIGNDLKGLILTLKAFEIEARNMEMRIELLTGTTHVPLDGQLLGNGAEIEINSQTKGL